VLQAPGRPGSQTVERTSRGLFLNGGATDVAVCRTGGDRRGRLS